MFPIHLNPVRVSTNPKPSFAAMDYEGMMGGGRGRQREGEEEWIALIKERSRKVGEREGKDVNVRQGWTGEE